MSIIKKSDVKNYLSARRAKNSLLFRMANQPAGTEDSVSELRSANPNMPSSSNRTDTSIAKKPAA